MEHATLEKWINDYESVWRTPGTDRLGELFVDDVSYQASPWELPMQGLEDLATFWNLQRDGADEEFAMTSEVVAVDGEVGVARIEVRYGNGDRWRDIWIVHFNAAGRCVHFEEWPIARRASRPGRLCASDGQPTWPCQTSCIAAVTRLDGDHDAVCWRTLSWRQRRDNGVRLAMQSERVSGWDLDG